MIKRVLAPTDGSEQSARMVEQATRFAGSLKASICFLHVIDVKLLEAPFLKDLTALSGAGLAVPVVPPDLTRLLRQRGEEALALARGIAERAGVPCETRMVTGIVPRCICEEAALWDLVVLGRTGENRRWSEGGVGSITGAVARRCPTPVMVIAEAGPIAKASSLLLAYDGSPHARKALKTAVSLAREWDRELLILSVGQRAGALVDEAGAYAGDHGARATTVREQGDPRERIVAVARERDVAMVVVGAFGHGRLLEMMLGSTTSYVLEHVQSSVLLVR